MYVFKYKWLNKVISSKIFLCVRVILKVLEECYKIEIMNNKCIYYVLIYYDKIRYFNEM